MNTRASIDVIRARLRTLSTARADFSPLVDQLGAASFALLGEASHGTHEFYGTRAEITKKLIEEHGLNAVAVEADWPDAHRVNRYVLGRSDDKTPEQALSGFQRFPRWMWRNRVVEEFVGWLREWNQSRKPDAPPVGFYGMDLYSLNTSRAEVIKYLERVDPEAARRARERYACFDHYGDEQAYGLAASYGVAESCEEDAARQLAELQRRSYEYMHRDGLVAEDDFFSAEMNARLVLNAEEYYRSMFRGRVSSWNLRDQHMVETLDALAGWLNRRHGRSKIAVWAHNSHLGDARATSMGSAGELNVGQLVRQRYPGQSFIVGFTTYSGTVTAASDWGGDAETKRVRPALPGSWEELFHEAGDTFMLQMRDDETLSSALAGERLERAIGVIYRPDTERVSHYFEARLTRQFDAVIHVDKTTAIEPLDVLQDAAPEEVPETFPTGV